MTAAERIRPVGTRFERTLLARPGAIPDTTTRVTWLQGERLYCDLRRPATLQTVTASTLAEMEIDDLVALASQDGFAGRLLDSSNHVEWERAVSFHPLGPTPDAGTLEALDTDTLVEHGVFEEYTEHWRITDVSPDIEEYLLEDVETGATAVLVRVGECFAFGGVAITRSDPNPSSNRSSAQRRCRMPERCWTARSRWVASKTAGGPSPHRPSRTEAGAISTPSSVTRSAPETQHSTERPSPVGGVPSTRPRG